MAGRPQSLENNPEHEKEPDGHPQSVFARWSSEWQQTARRGQPGENGFKSLDTSSTHVPAFELTQNSEQVRNVTLMNAQKGTHDTVAGINPRPGESLADLFKRLHPNLSDQQLAKEVQKVLKYNHDYGNDLGDGKALDPARTVFLTSVKYVDEHGRISRIEGPTGRVTDIAYDEKGMAGFKISEPDGRIVEQAQKDAGGHWSAVRDGQKVALKEADIDIYGNITVTGADGNKVGHLTRGDDVKTRFEAGKPVESETVRNGEKLVTFEYEPTEGGYKIFARYPDSPQTRVPINPEFNAEESKRIALALGKGPQAYADEVKNTSPEPSDVQPDQYVANRIVNAAYQQAKEMGTTGWCYSGVAQALDKVGVHLTGRRAYMAKEQLLEDKRFQVASIDDLRPGDVLVHGRTAAHESGHIAVYLGNGMEASDHVQSLIRGSGYGGTTVFRYVGDRSSA